MTKLPESLLLVIWATYHEKAPLDLGIVVATFGTKSADRCLTTETTDTGSGTCAISFQLHSQNEAFQRD